MHSIMSEVLTIDRIEVSPLNVRRHRAAIENLGPMEASILGSGLIQPLNVHPMRGRKNYFGAFAGGRRTRAIRNLVKRGALPADWPVRVEIYHGFSDVEIIELSLGENIPRAELELYEICAGIRALLERQQSIEAIADALGQDLTLVRKWQRIGQLAEPIFEAFAQGVLKGDDARAYAATADKGLQLAAYEDLHKLPEWQRSPEKIRAALKVGDRQAGRMLRLVGAEAYRKAGGRFELDLFAGDAGERGRIVDEGVLKSLAETKLEQLRAETRGATRPDLRFIAKPPEDGRGSRDHTLQAQIRAKAGGGLEIPDGVVAVIELTESGSAEVGYWWESRSAKYGSPAGKAEKKLSEARPAGGSAISDPYHHAPVAKAKAKEEHGTSADALFAVRSIRRELLRALMVEEAGRGGQAGLCYAAWAQLRYLLAPKSEAIGLRAPAKMEHEVGVANSATELARDRVEEQQAHCAWSAAVRQVMAEPYITEPDLGLAFRHFLHTGDAARRLAGAVLAGLLLERSAATPGYDFASHRELAAACGATEAWTLRGLWQPTSEFLELFPKSQQLAIARPILDDGTYGRWEKLKAADLPLRLAQALSGGGQDVPSRYRDQARKWVHPLLAFSPPEQGGDDGDSGPANDAGVELAAAE